MVNDKSFTLSIYQLYQDKLLISFYMQKLINKYESLIFS